MNRLGLRFLGSVALGILPAALLACSGSQVSTSRTSVAPSFVLEVGEVFPDLRLPALGRRPSRVARPVQRAEGDSPRLCLLVSGLPCARARVARSNEGAPRAGSASDGGDHPGAAPRSCPPIHAVEGNGLADPRGFPQPAERLGRSSDSRHRRAWGHQAAQPEAGTDRAGVSREDLRAGRARECRRVDTAARGRPGGAWRRRPSQRVASVWRHAVSLAAAHAADGRDRRVSAGGRNRAGSWPDPLSPRCGVPREVRLGTSPAERLPERRGSLGACVGH